MLTSEEFAAAIKAAQLIQGVRGVCSVTADDGVHLLPGVLAQHRTGVEDIAIEQVHLDSKILTYPWKVRGTVCGVGVFALANDTGLRRHFPDLVPNEEATE